MVVSADREPHYQRIERERQDALYEEGELAIALVKERPFGGPGFIRFQLALAQWIGGIMRRREARKNRDD